MRFLFCFGGKVGCCEGSKGGGSRWKIGFCAFSLFGKGGLCVSSPLFAGILGRETQQVSAPV